MPAQNLRRRPPREALKREGLHVANLTGVAASYSHKKDAAAIQPQNAHGTDIKRMQIPLGIPIHPPCPLHSPPCPLYKVQKKAEQPDTLPGFPHLDCPGRVESPQGLEKHELQP